MYFHLAEALGRTVDELLLGSAPCPCGHVHGGFRPITASELTEWAAHWKLKRYEYEEARREAEAKRGR